MDKNEFPGLGKQIKEKNESWSALSLAWELGYSIAIPLVLLALLGRFIDKKFGTSPWFLLIGVIFSLIISTVLVYKKTIMIMDDSENKEKKEKKEKKKKMINI